MSSAVAVAVAVHESGPTVRRSRAVVWALWTIAMLCAGGAALLILASLTVELPDRGFGFRGWVPLVGALWATVGARIAVRQPRISVGWLILTVGLLWCVNGLFEEYTTYSYFPEELGLPLVEQLVWFDALVGTAVAGISGIALLVIPDGRLRSPRWYPVAAFVVIATCLSLLLWAVYPRRLAPFPFDNPFGIGDLAGYLDLSVARRALDIVRGFVVVVPAVAVVVRLRASRGAQREQLKWVAVAAVYTAVLVFVYAFVGGRLVEYAQLAGLVLVPLAFAIAMRRYRLYEIDRLLNGTIVIGIATALLGGAYVASIGIMQRIFTALTGERSDAAIVLTTLLAAAAFAPLKDRVQTLVRRTFGGAVLGTHGLDAFADEIAAHLRLSEPDGLLMQLLAESVGSLGATGGALERLGNGEHGIHAIGIWSGVPTLAAEVRRRGEVVARVMLSPRANGAAYDGKALDRLDRAARLVGLALDRIDPLPGATAGPSALVGPS